MKPESPLRTAWKRLLTPEWLMTAMGVVWLTGFPFWQDGSYSHITRAKWIGMLVLTWVTVACALAALAMRLHRREKLRPGWMHIAGAAYFIWVALSAAFGSWADHAGVSGRLTVIEGAYRYEGLITQMCYGAIFLCMSVAKVKVRPLLHAASAGMIAYGVFVALQYAGLNVLGLFPEGTSVRTNYEFQGPLGNIDMVVGYVALVTTAGLTGYVLLEKPRSLWLAAGLTGVLLLLLMEVQCGLILLAAMLFMLGLLALRRPESRWRVAVVFGGTLLLLTVRLLIALPWLDGTADIEMRFAWWRLLPALAGIFLLGGAWWLKRRPGKALSAGMTVGIGAALVVAAVVAVYVLPIPAGNGLWELQEILHGRPQDAFGSERIGVWRLTLEMCRDDLLWGHGPDTFLHAMDHHLWETGQSLVQRFDNPHNLFLGVLANSGLPALGLYLLLTLGVPGHALLCSRRRAEAVPLALAAISYLVQGMFTFSICLVTPMYWALMGLLAGQMSEMKKRKETDS